MNAPFTIGPEAAGQRIDVWLTGQAIVGSRTEAQKLLQAGMVLRNRTAATKNAKLKIGDVIELVQGAGQLHNTAGSSEQAGTQVGEPGDLIVYQDSRIIVVDKPAGLVVHPARGHETGTLSQILVGLVAGGEEFRPGIVHRLDKDTSGLMVVARDAEAHRFLKQAIERRAVTREYMALVSGRPDSQSGTIDAPIGRGRADRVQMSIATDRPRVAVTHFAVEEQLGDLTLLRVTLDTGRTHQIRVHLKAIGLPVCGDPTYGGRSPDLGLTRQFLHATRLAFPHPDGDRQCTFESPLAPDLTTALDIARNMYEGR